MDQNTLLCTRNTTLKLIEEWSSNLINIQLSIKSILEQGTAQGTLTVGTSTNTTNSFRGLGWWDDDTSFLEEDGNLSNASSASTASSSPTNIEYDLSSQLSTGDGSNLMLQCSHSIDKKIKEFALKANGLSGIMDSMVSSPQLHILTVQQQQQHFAIPPSLTKAGKKASSKSTNKKSTSRKGSQQQQQQQTSNAPVTRSNSGNKLKHAKGKVTTPPSTYPYPATPSEYQHPSTPASSHASDATPCETNPSQWVVPGGEQPAPKPTCGNENISFDMCSLLLSQTFEQLSQNPNFDSNFSVVVNPSNQQQAITVRNQSYSTPHIQAQTLLHATPAVSTDCNRAAKIESEAPGELDIDWHAFANHLSSEHIDINALFY